MLLQLLTCDWQIFDEQKARNRFEQLAKNDEQIAQLTMSKTVGGPEIIKLVLNMEGNQDMLEKQRLQNAIQMDKRMSQLIKIRRFRADFLDIADSVPESPTGFCQGKQIQRLLETRP